MAAEVMMGLGEQSIRARGGSRQYFSGSGVIAVSYPQAGLAKTARSQRRIGNSFWLSPRRCSVKWNFVTSGDREWLLETCQSAGFSV